MNDRAVKRRKELRMNRLIQKYREYGILSEEELNKLRMREEWIISYLKNHTYFSLASMTGDFMLQEWNISIVGRSETPALEIRRHLIYGFKHIIQKFKEEGKIVKTSSKTYKVIKNF